MKRLFLKQAVTPAPPGKGRQVPNHRGPTRVIQEGGTDAAEVQFISNITGIVKRLKHSQNYYLKGRV